jgi:hypothetical protein
MKVFLQRACASVKTRHRMQGFADHKSAPTDRRLGLEARSGWRFGRPKGWRRVWKLMLDDDTESGIEWQASLIESQFDIAGATAQRDRADESGWRKRSEN